MIRALLSDGGYLPESAFRAYVSSRAGFRFGRVAAGSMAIWRKLRRPARRRRQSPWLRDLSAQPQYDVRAGAVATNLDPVRQVNANGFEQRRAPRGIVASYPAQVPLVHSAIPQRNEKCVPLSCLVGAHGGCLIPPRGEAARYGLSGARSARSPRCTAVQAPSRAATARSGPRVRSCYRRVCRKERCPGGTTLPAVNNTTWRPSLEDGAMPRRMRARRIPHCVNIDAGAANELRIRISDPSPSA